MKKITHSSEETQQVASKVAQRYKQGGIILLSGPLGAGKTTFTQGFAQSLGIKDQLISPTFILMRSYPLPDNKKGFLYHIDLYRLNEDDAHQLEELGITEIVENPENVVLIEWPERLGDNIPKGAITIKLNLISENSREIEIIDF